MAFGFVRESAVRREIGAMREEFAATKAEMETQLAELRSENDMYESLAESARPNTGTDRDQGFNPVGGSDTRYSFQRLHGISFERVCTALLKLYRQNPIAASTIRMIAGFSVGDGIEFQAEDEGVKAILDEHWEENEWDVYLLDRIREHALFGEQVWPAPVNPVSGAVYVMDIHPAEIIRVDVSKRWARKIDRVWQRWENLPEGRPYSVVNRRISDPATPDPNMGKLVGEVFYLRANSILGDPRGWSDLLSVNDWLKALDAVLFSGVDRAELSLKWFLDVTLGKGAAGTPGQWRRYFSNLNPGAVRVHGDGVTVQDIAPSLIASELESFTQTYKRHISGGTGFPPAWYGDGTDTNKATLDKMNAPTLKMLQARRTALRHDFARLGRFVLQNAQDAGRLPAGMDLSFEVSLPDIAEEDLTVYSTALGSVVAAMAVTDEKGFLSRKTEISALAKLLDKFGVAFDPEEELAAAAEEKKLRDEEAMKQAQTMFDATGGPATEDGDDGAPR